MEWHVAEILSHTDKVIQIIVEFTFVHHFGQNNKFDVKSIDDDVVFGIIGLLSICQGFSVRFIGKRFSADCYDIWQAKLV